MTINEIAFKSGAVRFCSLKYRDLRYPTVRESSRIVTNRKRRQNTPQRTKSAAKQRSVPLVFQVFTFVLIREDSWITHFDYFPYILRTWV